MDASQHKKTKMRVLGPAPSGSINLTRITKRLVLLKFNRNLLYSSNNWDITLFNHFLIRDEIFIVLQLKAMQNQGRSQ